MDTTTDERPCKATSDTHTMPITSRLHSIARVKCTTRRSNFKLFCWVALNLLAEHDVNADDQVLVPGTYLVTGGRANLHVSICCHQRAAISANVTASLRLQPSNSTEPICHININTTYAEQPAYLDTPPSKITLI